MTFEEELKQALGQAERDATSTAAAEYRDVLSAVTRVLESEGIGAFIRVGADPRRLTLYVHPRHRPARCNAMLMFFLEGSSIRMFGEEQLVLTAPEDLKRRLIEFVKLPAFRESLQLLRDEATLPVEARLRRSARRSFSDGDVMVAVSATDQERLANASTGSDVELNVERIEFPGNAAFSGQYKILYSAGIHVDIEKTTSVLEGRLCISGKRCEPPA
jgi:hypothetical protein